MEAVSHPRARPARPAPVVRPQPPRPAFDLSAGSYRRSLRRLGWLLLLVGLLVRAERSALSFPLWADEAFVAINCAERDYRGLTGALTFGQVVPVLFLWGERTAYLLLGASEWAMRLLPFTLGCASLWLLWRLARQAGPPLAALLSVGILAVSMWPISMSCSVKPYSADLFCSLLLAAVAASWLRRPERWGRMLLLALAAPLAVTASYPAVFVGGGVSLALLPAVCRRAGGRGKALFVLYNLLLIGSFAGHYTLVGREQINPATSEIGAFLQYYWDGGFPPANPLRWPLWWLDLQTGQMMAYPCGSAHGGSVITFALSLVGAVVWWRTGRRALLRLMAAPFALNLLAAALHRYPYGASGRLAQHLAPACCLLAGTGLARLIERFSRSLHDRLWYARCWAATFLVLAVAVAVFQAHRPHRDDDDAPWTRGIVRELTGRVRPGDQVVVLCEKEYDRAVLWWYLGTQNYPVVWGGRIDRARLGEDGCLWVCDHRRGPNAAPRRDLIGAWVRPFGRQVVGCVSWFTQPRDYGVGCATRWDLYLCAPPGRKVEMPFFPQGPGS